MNEIKAKKTTQAADNSRNHMKDMYNYKCVDGRTYQTDKTPKVYAKRTTRLRPQYEKKRDADKTVSCQNIRSVEQYLKGEKITPFDKVNEVYSFVKYDDKGEIVTGIADHVFNVLKEKYQNASYYLGWTDLYMSMKNGHPLRTEPLIIEKTEHHETFAMDEVVRKFEIGDTVWTYFPNGVHVTAEKATVDSWYIKELKDGTCDVMYGLKSPAFGLDQKVWRLQRNNKIFDNEKDAINLVETMN